MTGTSQALARGESVGRYVVLDLLGVGGMGAVYSAYDPQLDRKVALKLLHARGRDGEDAPARLVREAQAMARLAHPNVITVHDVGGYRGQVFVAMEFIDGRTLTAWLNEGQRPFRAVLAPFLAAGRGLHAAHLAGLVHRDFKPDNVLLGKDGRVCVCDFGLARATDDDALQPAPHLQVLGGEDMEEQSVSGVLAMSITRAGLVVGTMEYMAPEQFTARPLDARTDQFSFCVALYEALYRKRPYAGDTYAVLTKNVLAGRLEEPPRDSSVPAWVRRALVRGMQTDPAARFPSMVELLAELGRDPAASRRRLLGAAGAVALLGVLGAGFLSLRGRQQRICRGAAAQLDGVWDDDRRAQVERAFLATGKEAAAQVFDGARRTLDAYAASWQAMHVEACEATRVRGEQSQEALDLRMECLDDRRKELEVLTALYLRADAVVLDRAIQAAGTLSPLEPCADRAALRAQVRPPRDPAQRARAAALRKALAEAKTLKHAGKFQDGLRLAEAAVREAPALGYRPVEAEALYMLGDLEGEGGQLRPAEEHLRQALWVALGARHDRIAARAAARLVSVVGSLQARHGEGRIFGEVARAHIERMGGDVLLEAKVLNNLGELAVAEGRYEEALGPLQRAVTLRQRANRPDHAIVAESVGNLGEAYLKLGRLEDALRELERARVIWERALGPDHPSVARSLDQLGVALSGLGRPAAAVTHLRRALAIRQRELGPAHPGVGASLHRLGDALEAAGEGDEAMARNEEALALFRKALGPEHPSVAECLSSLGRELIKGRRFAEALGRYQEALRIQERALKPDHPDVARTLLAIGQGYLQQRKPKLALPPLTRAATVAERALGPEHPTTKAIAEALALARCPRRGGCR